MQKADTCPFLASHSFLNLCVQQCWRINESGITTVKKHSFIKKAISYPATCFDSLGAIFRMLFETYKEVHRSCAEGRSRFLQVFVTSLIYLLVCFQHQTEDDPWRVETCSWLTYYFYKVLFLMVVNVPLLRWNL